jgi:outer membrane protein assembly factor BamA
MPWLLASLAAAALAAAPPDAPPPAAPEPAPPAQEGSDALAALPRYQVEAIAFEGLSHVRPWAARRHVVVRVGQLLDEEEVTLSRLRLLQLGWFSRVETKVARGSARGRVVVVFQVVERNTLLISELVLGSTGPQPLYGGLGLTQQNFLGQGLGLSGAFVTGGSPAGRPQDPDRFAARAGFFAPDVAVAGLRLVAGAQGLFLRGEELACADASCSAYRGHYGDAPRLRYQRAGGEVTVGLRPGPFDRISGGVRAERLRAEGAGLPEGPVPPILPGWSTLVALSGTWELDTRDDLFYPTEGLHALTQVTFSSRLVGSDYEYSRYVLQLDTGFGLLGRPLRLQALVGATQGGAPFFERFYPADLSYFAVGPALARALELNFSADGRYHAFAAMGGLEWGVPLWSRGGFFQRGYLAAGVRGVWSSATLGGGRSPFSSWPISFDLALRLDTPVGSFNASLGAAVDNLL